MKAALFSLVVALRRAWAAPPLASCQEWNGSVARQRKTARLLHSIGGGLALIAFSFGTLAQGVLTFNGGFDAGEDGWLFSGGATVVATGEPNDNPFGRVPDGPLVFLYQKMSSAAAQFTLSFDFFTEAMSTTFPSPGGFPDTSFATIYFAPTDPALRPELLLSGAALTVFDFDAVNGLQSMLPGAIIGDSPARPGWRQFAGNFSSIEGQPFFAVTFQTLNANGVAGDSAFYVDNLHVAVVPEPAAVTGLLLLVGTGVFLTRVGAKGRK
jgi:hypothetical protein